MAARRRAVTLQLAIPANTSATIDLQADSADAVTERRALTSRNPAITFLRMENGRAVFAVASGRYEFTTQTPPHGTIG